MKKLMVLIVALLTSSSAFAGYGSGTVDRVFVDVDGWVYFGVTVPPAGTCNYFIDQFRFSSTATAGGKQMLATLMAAKVSGSSVHVWYTDSTAPGTDQSNGCTSATMAVASTIGIR